MGGYRWPTKADRRKQLLRELRAYDVGYFTDDFALRWATVAITNIARNDWRTAEVLRLYYGFIRELEPRTLAPIARWFDFSLCQASLHKTGGVSQLRRELVALYKVHGAADKAKVRASLEERPIYGLLVADIFQPAFIRRVLDEKRCEAPPDSNRGIVLRMQTRTALVRKGVLQALGARFKYPPYVRDLVTVPFSELKREAHLGHACCEWLEGYFDLLNIVPPGFSGVRSLGPEAQEVLRSLAA